MGETIFNSRRGALGRMPNTDVKNRKTAPDYISHVAIYLGDGKMIQAPEPGMDVEVVRVDLGSDFAGAVEVSPTVAVQVAATSV